MTETFEGMFIYNLRKSEFTAPETDDNNPIGRSLLEPNYINFKFSSKAVVFECVFPTHDSPAVRMESRFFPIADDHLLSMSRRQFYRSDESRQTMDEKLRGLVVNFDDRKILVDFAFDQAQKHLESNNIPTADIHQNGQVVLNLHINIYLLVTRPVFTLEDPSFRMVPAADSSIEGLKRAAAADYVGRNMSCSICLEEFSGKEGGGDDSCCEEEGLLIMPCSHVFHGDCIKKWLSVSHYCPLCRLEMPTTTN